MIAAGGMWIVVFPDKSAFTEGQQVSVEAAVSAVVAKAGKAAPERTSKTPSTATD